MREILFKAKRVKNGKWIEGYCFKATYHWHEHGIHEDWIVSNAIQNGGWCQTIEKYPIDKRTLCQFTGLYDRNGDRVWENDILFPQQPLPSVLPFLVRYNQFTASFVGFDLFFKKEFDINGEMIRYCEVFGNSLDNFNKGR